jgi:hypothetical protein
MLGVVFLLIALVSDSLWATGGALMIGLGGTLTLTATKS